MNAIVSLYKNFVLALLFVVLAGGILAIMMVATSDAIAGETRGLVIAGIVAGTLFVFLMVAWSAVIISLHDRHNEIAEGVHRIADALEQCTAGGQLNAGRN